VIHEISGLGKKGEKTGTGAALISRSHGQLKPGDAELKTLVFVGGSIEEMWARFLSLSLPRSLPWPSLLEYLLENLTLLVIHPAVAQQKVYFQAVHVDAVAIGVGIIDEGAKRPASPTCAPIYACGSLHLARLPPEEEE